MTTTQKLDIAMLKGLFNGISTARATIETNEKLISTYLQEVIREVLSNGDALTLDEIRKACESRSAELKGIGQLTYWYYKGAVDDLEKAGGIKRAPVGLAGLFQVRDRYVSVES